MNEHPLIQFIGRFIDIAPATAAKIIESFEPVRFSRQDYLLKAGRISGYFFLEQGFMRAFTLDTKGQEVTTYFYSNHSMVFDVSSFFGHTKSTESIQAMTDCNGYLTSLQGLNGLFHSIQEFREFARLMLIREFVAYKQRTLSLINAKAEDRYTALLSNHPEVFRHAQLQHIASYLGITPTSLSRIRKSFSKR